MGRMLALGVLVAASLTGLASPASAGFTSATFGETGTLTADGRVAVVSLRLACTDGHVGFTVSLTQGDVSGVKRGAAQCRDTEDMYIYMQPGEPIGPSGPIDGDLDPPESAFAPGAARACGQVIFQEPGGGEETYRWCSDVLLQPGRHRP